MSSHESPSPPGSGNEATIMDGLEGGQPGRILEQIHDRTTGQYFAPPQQEDPEFKRLFALSRGVAVDAVDDVLRREGSKFVAAILDTGVLHEHPLLADAVIDEVDFTGEGTDDLHGHGTLVSLISRAGQPWTPLLNVKVIGRTGKGSADAIVEGLMWVRGYQRSHPEVSVVANLSCGVYSLHAWGYDCRGDCRLCRAAIAAGESDVAVLAAAGNEPGLTACPATAGVYREGTAIIAVAALDESGRPLSSSGYGTFATVGVVHLEPVSDRGP